MGDLPRDRADVGATTGPMTALVLAAGLGTRMRPLTDDRPKPMVAVAGRALIDHVLDRLMASGITRAVVNVHYQADVLERHLARRQCGPDITISDERGLLLETGGAVVKAAPLLWLDASDSRPVLIHNSDSIWLEGTDRALDRLITSFDPDAMDSLLLLAPITASLGYSGRGDFAMDQGGRVRRRREREIVPFVFTGVSIASRRLLDGAPAGAFSLNLLWNRAIESGRLFGIRLDGLWMHVGDPAARDEAELRIEAGG